MDRIDRMVREANPVPDPTVLIPTASPPSERAAANLLGSQPQGPIPSRPREPRWRGPLVGVAAGVALLVATALIVMTGDEAPPLATATTTVTTLAPPMTSTTPTVPTTTPLPEFPPERSQLVQGEDTWAVVLAAVEGGGGEEVDAADAAARSAGYAPGITDCDSGAATALGLPEEGHYYITVSVYFDTRDDAEAALAAFEARGIYGAVGLVQPFCLD